MSGPFLLSFLPVFTAVASWITFVSLTSLLSVPTWTVTSPFLQNADCLVDKCLASCSRSGGMPPGSPHSATNSLLSCIVAAIITLLQKCDGSVLSFCLKLIELCPPTFAPWLLISLCYRYNLILPHIPFCPIFHILLLSLDCTL